VPSPCRSAALACLLSVCLALSACGRGEPPPEGYGGAFLLAWDGGHELVRVDLEDGDCMVVYHVPRSMQADQGCLFGVYDWQRHCYYISGTEAGAITRRDAGSWEDTVIWRTVAPDSYSVDSLPLEISHDCRFLVISVRGELVAFDLESMTERGRWPARNLERPVMWPGKQWVCFGEGKMLSLTTGRTRRWFPERVHDISPDGRLVLHGDMDGLAVSSRDHASQWQEGPLYRLRNRIRVNHHPAFISNSEIIYRWHRPTLDDALGDGGKGPVPMGVMVHNFRNMTGRRLQSHDLKHFWVFRPPKGEAAKGRH
jgi:hypothetical protein